MKEEKAPLSPVSEAVDEEEDEDGGLMMYDMAEVGVPAVSYPTIMQYLKEYGLH